MWTRRVDGNGWGRGGWVSVAESRLLGFFPAGGTICIEHKLLGVVDGLGWLGFAHNLVRYARKKVVGPPPQG